MKENYYSSLSLRETGKGVGSKGRQPKLLGYHLRCSIDVIFCYLTFPPQKRGETNTLLFCYI